MSLSALVGVAFAFVAYAGWAAEVVLTAVADTTLIEATPENNAGAVSFVNAGTTQNFTRNRGLFRFDVASQIPPGSTITATEVILEVVGVPVDGFTPAVFGWHRVLVPWGEGNKQAEPGHPGMGSAASAGEATWLARFTSTAEWNAPGGEAGTDYAVSPSTETTIYHIPDSPYTFNSSSWLVSDVQAMLDQPEQDFGWILICRNESENFTARRFGSREDSLHPPLLRVQFLPPAKIDVITVENGTVTLEFLAIANQPYTVERSASLGEQRLWGVITNVPALSTDERIRVADEADSEASYYRLRLD